MLDRIKTLHTAIANATAADATELEVFRQKFIAKKGLIAALFHDLKNRSADERKALGPSLNALKHAAKEKFPNDTCSRSSECRCAAAY